MNVIKQRRENMNITQSKLADTLNIDRSAVAKWETGEAFPRSDKLPLLAKVLNCTIDDLFADESETGKSI